MLWLRRIHGAGERGREILTDVAVTAPVLWLQLPILSNGQLPSLATIAWHRGKQHHPDVAVAGSGVFKFFLVAWLDIDKPATLWQLSLEGFDVVHERKPTK